MPLRKKSRQQFNAMNPAQRYTEYTRMHFTASQRGKTIGGLYSALNWVINNNPQFIDANRVDEDVPILNPPDNIEADIENLALLLTNGEDPTPLNMTCNICFETYDSNQHKPIMYGCGHTICLACLLQLPRDAAGRRKCQSCREIIEKVTVVYM